MLERIKTITNMLSRSEALRQEGKSIGFVPTMGALHEGHLQLVREATRNCDVTVSSIFVNPSQFGPNEDLDRYPRNLEQDAVMLQENGCQILLTLKSETMYPPGFKTWVEVEGLTDSLCGPLRPGHFRGVTTVVTKLFHIVRPHKAYFGWKDAQQALIIEQLTRDLNFGIDIVLVPTVRDKDGLALSSRNQYLSEEERERALLIPRAIKRAREYFQKGGRDAKLLTSELYALFEGQKETRIDYISLVRKSDLATVETIDRNTMLALAVYVGSTRLIDNYLFTDDEPCSEA